MSKIQYTKKNKAQKTNTKTKSFRKLRKKSLNKNKLSKKNNKRKCGCGKTKKNQKGGSILKSIKNSLEFRKVNNILKDIEKKLLQLLDDYYKKEKKNIKNIRKSGFFSFFRTKTVNNRAKIEKQRTEKEKLNDNYGKFKKTITEVVESIKTH